MKISSEVIGNLPLAYSKLLKSKVQQKNNIISLGLGEPSLLPPKELIDATIKSLVGGNNRYINSLGDIGLRERIKDKLHVENSINADLDNIVITFGAKQALLIALQAILEPNDEVININPCYLSYSPIIKMAEPESRIHNFDLNHDDFSIDFYKLGKLFNNKTRAIIINSPHNPTGKVFSKKEINKIIEILLKFPQVYVISDDVYEYFVYRSFKHFSLGSFESISQRVFTINSFGKTYGIMGWRIGYMVVPKTRINIVSKILLHTNTNVTSFLQKSIQVVFDLSNERLIKYTTQLENISEYIYYQFLNIGIKIVKPNGGFFSFVDVSSLGMDSDEFAMKLLNEQNVAINPGLPFGNNWNNFIRISFAGEEDEVKEGVQRTINLAKIL